MLTRPHPSSALVLLLSLAACKSEPAVAQRPSKSDLEPAAAAATADVPDALGATLEFVVVEVDDGEILAVVPKGWSESEVIPGRFTPPGAKIGEGVGVAVGTNCDGVCSPKDWKAVTAKVEFTGYDPPLFAVELDEALGDTGRLVVYSGGPEVHIRAAWWKPDSNRYVMCSADLSSQWSMAKAAFIRACKATLLVEWN